MEWELLNPEWENLFLQRMDGKRYIFEFMDGAARRFRQVRGGQSISSITRPFNIPGTYITVRLMKRLVVTGQLVLLLALSLRGQEEPLTHASQIRDLSRAEAAKHLPVKLRGTLTYYNPVWNALFLQDETGAVYVTCHDAGDDITTNLQPGQILEVTGKTDVGAVHCDIAATALHVVGTGPLPPPLDLSVPNLLTKENERLRVKATGQIFSIGNVGGRPSLQLLTASGFLLDLDLPQGSYAEAENLAGSSIELEGVLALELAPGRRFTGQFNIFVTEMDAVRTIKSVPIVPIAKLAANGQPARIRAILEDSRPGSARVRDFSGFVEVEYADKSAFSPGTTVEIFGYPEQRSTGLVMTRARASVPVSGDPSLPVLTTIAKVRDLSAQEAARGFPVEVRGVVTFDESDSENLQLHFVQDHTAGIYVSLSDIPSNVLPPVGTSIELWGFTDPGGFAPLIVAEGLRVIGPGKYPNAALIPSQLLMTGALDSQWVEVHGVVRSATAAANHMLVSLSTGDALIQMVVMGGAHTIPSNFIGASIQASGVCRTLFDTHRHLQGIGICVPDWDQIEIKEAEVADPFQLPPSPISGLFEFHGGGYGLNRFHIRGRNILQERNGAFFVQDASGGILVQASETIPGTDWVDVVGFPALKDQLPVLQDVLVRPTGPHVSTPTPIRPTRLSPETALDEALNATLVTLDGRVLTHSYSTSEETVAVQFGQRLIDVIMVSSDRGPLLQFAPNSTVRFTGVYVAQLDNNRQIQSFQILLRSPADAVVISVPPWWTALHALYVFGGLSGVLLLALAWVAGLREQVRRRTTQLRAEINEHKNTETKLGAEIVERKRSGEALRQSEERYQLLFSKNPLPMWVLDAETLRFLAVNETAVREYGYSADEFLSMAMEEIQPSQDVPALSRYIATGKTPGADSVVGRHRKKDASIIDVEIICRKIVFDGRDARLVLANDITEKKRLEAQFLHAQRMEGIGVLATGMAHDLNNILAPILVSAGILRCELTPEERNQTITRIETSVKRGADIIQQVMTFGRGVSGERAAINPADLVEEVSKITGQTFPKDITITLDTEPGLRPIIGDKTQIHQVLLNLCINARDAMPKGGTLCLSARNVMMDAPFSNGDQQVSPGPYVRLQVTDTGEGIPAANLDKIFDQFFTTKELGKGTGLGLSTVLGIVKSHRGIVTVESELKKGTTFKVLLPASGKTVNGAELNASIPLPHGKGQAILFVDDEADIVSANCRMLEEYGYKVLAAKSSDDALAIFARNGQSIDVVVTDIMMPGMNGMELIRKLKKIAPEIKVIATSGLGRNMGGSPQAAEMESLNVINFLRKPYTVQNLLTTLYEALDEKQMVQYH